MFERNNFIHQGFVEHVLMDWMELKTYDPYSGTKTFFLN